VMLVFVGGGVERNLLRQTAAERSLDNVMFLDRLPMTEIGAVLRGADVLLVHLRDDALFSITIPSKTQAYMAIGRPVLMAVSGDAADLVQASRCGVAARSEDPVSICDAVLRLACAERGVLAAMAEAGRSYYRANLSQEVGVREFAGIFERLMAARAQ
jgi:colanic acid biosynthesis glycosyl transferase WcaI